MRIQSNFLLALFFVMPALLLQACSSIKERPMLTRAVDSMSGKKHEREMRLSVAGREALAAGKYSESAVFFGQVDLEKIMHDREFAPAYMQALRKSGQVDRADRLLSRMHKSDFKNMSPRMLNEYAAVKIAKQNFTAAEEALHAVLSNEEAKEAHADASHMMGQVQHAQGNHIKAIRYFNRALDKNIADPGSVMMSKAVCQAEIGQKDKAMSTLDQALIIAQDKSEVARQIKAVRKIKAVCSKDKKGKPSCKKKRG